MAKFQCNASKTLVEVFTEYDINGMRLNPSYTELVEVTEEEIPEIKPKKAVKKPALEEE